MQPDARRDGTPRQSDGATAPPDLRLAVVEYDEGPDRGTIHPPELPGVEPTETWLSVDMSVVVDLSSWR